MLLQVNPNSWSCMAAAFSTALGIRFADFIKLMGHDGSGQPYEDKRFHRGFHIQECIDLCLMTGFACTEIQCYYGSKPFVESIESVPVYPLKDCEFRFQHYLRKTKRGVITGLGQCFGHAVAWDGKFIYDPRSPGYMYRFEDAVKYNFRPQTLWILTKMEPDDVKKILEG
ncbi:MAG: hypothetical protein WC315_00225 [Candidatus Omnitrophota bacterium]